MPKPDEEKDSEDDPFDHVFREENKRLLNTEDPTTTSKQSHGKTK